MIPEKAVFRGWPKKTNREKIDQFSEALTNSTPQNQDGAFFHTFIAPSSDQSLI